jgi:hypothetical protein
MTRSCDEDPPFDYVLALLLEATFQDLTVLPTHRLVRGIGADGATEMLVRAPELFEVTPVASSADLIAVFSGIAPETAGGRGRFGLWTRAGGAVLAAKRDAFEPLLPTGGEAVRALDVSLLGAALAHLAGVDSDAVAGGAIEYTKSARDAVAAVDVRADAAFLLEPTPVAAIEAVAREGDVMPQKSTYFYPKALTGLVINPHEW